MTGGEDKYVRNMHFYIFAAVVVAASFMLLAQVPWREIVSGHILPYNTTSVAAMEMHIFQNVANTQGFEVVYAGRYNVKLDTAAQTTFTMPLYVSYLDSGNFPTLDVKILHALTFGNVSIIGAQYPSAYYYCITGSGEPFSSKYGMANMSGGGKLCMRNGMFENFLVNYTAPIGSLSIPLLSPTIEGKNLGMRKYGGMQCDFIITNGTQAVPAVFAGTGTAIQNASVSLTACLSTQYFYVPLNITERIIENNGYSTRAEVTIALNETSIRG